MTSVALAMTLKLIIFDIQSLRISNSTWIDLLHRFHYHNLTSFCGLFNQTRADSKYNSYFVCNRETGQYERVLNYRRGWRRIHKFKLSLSTWMLIGADMSHEGAVMFSQLEVGLRW